MSDEAKALHRCTRGFVLCLVLASSTAWGEPWQTPLRDVVAVTADPDAADTKLGAYRAGLSAKTGIELPIAGGYDAMGWAIRLPMFVELHNVSGHLNYFPSEYWRGHLALAGLYRFRIKSVAAFLWLSAEHESDHATSNGTAMPDHQGFIYVNTVSVRGALSVPLQGQGLSTVLAARGVVLSCTFDADLCSKRVTSDGGESVQVNVDLMHDVPLSAEARQPWRWVTALHGAWLFPSDRVMRERRLVAATGIAVREGDLGLFCLRVELTVGNPVGYFRAKTEATSWGASFNWTP